MELKLMQAINNEFEKLSFNCTLWNWNRLRILSPYFLTMLLIVPYGIETKVSPILLLVLVCLLIVPYGIETRKTPRGEIELGTFNCTLWNWNEVNGKFYARTVSPFNCTLWNWNSFITAKKFFTFALLIVPYGIETRPTEVK